MIQRFFITTLLLITFASCKNTTKKITSFNSAVYKIDKEVDTLVDSVFLSVLAPYRDSIFSEMSRVLAKTQSGLESYKHESELSHLFSALFFKEGNAYLELNGKGFLANMSIVNHGGIRASLPKGDVTLRHVFQLMPFENNLAFVKVDGRLLQQIFNHMASVDGEGVGNARFGIKNKKAVDIHIGGKPINSDQMYWIATSDYLAKGGGGFEQLSGASDLVLTEIKIRDLIIQHFEKLTNNNQWVESKLDNRIYYAE